MIILIMQECAKGVGEPCKNQIWHWPGHLYDYSRKGTKGICAPGLRKGFLSITFTDKIHMSQYFIHSFVLGAINVMFVKVG